MVKFLRALIERVWRPPDLDASLEILQRKRARVWEIMGVLEDDPTQTISLLTELIDLCTTCIDLHPKAYRHVRAFALSRMGTQCALLGRLDMAADATFLATAAYRELVAEDRKRTGDSDALCMEQLAKAVVDSAMRHLSLRSLDAARECAGEGLAMCRELVSRGTPEAVDVLIHALNVQWAILSRSGERVPAGAAIAEALALSRMQHATGSAVANSSLAMTLNNLAIDLDAGELLDEALAASEEASAVFETLSRSDQARLFPDMALAATTLLYRQRRVGRLDETEALARTALKRLRELVEFTGLAYSLLVANRLTLLSGMLDAPHQVAESLALAEEATQHLRGLVANGESHVSFDLAAALRLTSLRLQQSKRAGEALPLARESVELLSTCITGSSPTELLELASSLMNLGLCEVSDDRKDDAVRSFRDCGKVLVDTVPLEPWRWTELARMLAPLLTEPQDVRDWHLPLLKALVEHRELAVDAEHASLFTALQAEVAARAWTILVSLGDGDETLIQEAVVILVSTLHSPDLSRWLRARVIDDEDAGELAGLKREVLASDQLYESLRQRLRQPPVDGGMQPTVENEVALSSPGEEPRELALRQQAAAVRATRERFRAKRSQVIAGSERMRAAFDAVDPRALRDAAGHAGADMALFLLQLKTCDQDRPVAAGVLIEVLSGTVRLLTFDGLHELCQDASNYNTAGCAGRARLIAEPVAPPDDLDLARLDQMAARLDASFWRLLDAQCQPGGPVSRLHICCHGMLQSLPLGLDVGRRGHRWHPMLWPGLPYLRLAASSRPAALDSNGPWIIGHDAAWNTDMPLPMAALEAALLSHLLRSHGRKVVACLGDTPMQASAAGFVACCHGWRRDAHFESALMLDGGSLTVGEIVDLKLSAALALLPACHAGETREDDAGNSLGIAAGFLLGGATVVTASSKAVPDALVPWLSTLTVWHVLHGLTPHDSALRARDQFSRLDFPPPFREWLQAALPEALAVLQPGGAEHPSHLQALLALEDAAVQWPWAGDARALFDADPQRRRRATASITEGLLRPQSDPAIANEVQTLIREMAAFMTVYGA